MNKKELLKILAEAKPDDEIVFQVVSIHREDKPELTFSGSVYRDRIILMDFIGNRHN